MKFVITLTIDNEADGKSKIIHTIEEQINKHIVDRFYGDDVDTYIIFLILVNPPDGFEHLFKDFKPKYTAYKSLKNRLTGEMMEIAKQFDYSIKFTKERYLEFVAADDKGCEKILMQEVVESLKHLDYLKKKAINFDVQKFKEDIIKLSEKLDKE